MPRNTSFEKRQLVIYHRARGKSGDQIAEMLQIPRSTVYDIIRRFDHENRIDLFTSTGRPKKCSARDERFLVRQVKKNPRTSAPKLKTKLHAIYNKEVSTQTIRRILGKHGYAARVPRRKPLISETNRKKRYQFAMRYVGVDESFWENVIFSDESKFNIFGSDGKQLVWRKANTEFEPQNVTKTVKHGGGSLQVWGCFSAQGVGTLVFIERIMDQYVYLEILQNNLLQSAEKLGILDSFVFYQDNDPKHKARLVMEWLLYRCPHRLDTPPQSPDCNPIENVWDYLDRKLRESPIRSKAHLKERLREEWTQIPPEYLRKLVHSMPRRLAAVIKARGNHTKY